MLYPQHPVAVETKDTFESEMKKDAEKCLETDNWVQPSTARYVGVHIDEPISLGRLLESIENAHEDVRLRTVNAVVLAFTDNVDKLKMNYEIPMSHVDIVAEVSKHLKMPMSKAKMLVFSLAGYNNIEMFLDENQTILFYCTPKDAREFMGTLPGHNAIDSESQLTLIYRQLSNILNYRLFLDFDMATKASTASAEINVAIPSEIIQDVPSLMDPRPLVYLEQQLIPATDDECKGSGDAEHPPKIKFSFGKKRSNKGIFKGRQKTPGQKAIERALDLLSRQRAGDRLSASNVSIQGCEIKPR